jgi:hypothetical protein
MLPVLLLAAGFGALQGASGCGRVDSPRADSETHWLTSCETDRDCGAGSCECGVCTAPCASAADCSALGFTGVECAPSSGGCGASGEPTAGTSAGASAVCLLPCVDDADCGALGSGAVCESQRCEQPAASLAEPVGAAGSTNATPLCDGSDDLRFLLVRPGSDGIAGYPFFTQERGSGFVAVDGQCRFWTSAAATEPVMQGTLSADGAAAFAAAIGYARFAEYTTVDEQDTCAGGVTRIWSPASRAQCTCRCPELEGWASVIDAMFDPVVQELLAGGQPATGPLRLALIGYPSNMDPNAPVAWPLSRAPAMNEVYYAMEYDPLLIDASSGAEITEPSEQVALRATRDDFATRSSGHPYTPLLWTDPDTQQPIWFHMVLRDEVPAHVQAELERPLF